MSYLEAIILISYLMTVAVSYSINKKLINKYYLEAARKGYKNISEDKSLYDFFYDFPKEVFLMLMPIVNIFSSVYHAIFKFNKKERSKLIAKEIEANDLVLVSSRDKEFFLECQTIKALDLIKDFSKPYIPEDSPNAFFRHQDPVIEINVETLHVNKTSLKEEVKLETPKEEIDVRRKKLREMKKALIRDIMLIIYTEASYDEKEKQVEEIVNEYCLKLSKHKNILEKK